MGQEVQDKKTHFANLLPRLDLDEDDFTDGDADNSDEGSARPAKRKTKTKRKTGRRQTLEPDDGDAGDNTVHPIMRSASASRVVFPPFVRLPGSSASQPDAAQSLQTHIPWTMGLSGDRNDEEDVVSDTDDEALFEELDEEVALDEQDQDAERFYEEKLWEAFDASRLSDRSFGANHGIFL